MRRATVSVLVPLLSTLGVLAVATPSGAQSTALLRSDCTGLSDCFTDMASLLSWTWGTRQPDAAAPLLIDIGAGEFGPFDCPDSGVPADPNGFVTVRGAGPETTRIYQALGFNIFDITGAVNLQNCTQVNFESLTIASESVGIVWNGTGTSRWSNIDVVAGGEGVYTAGWIEGTDGGAHLCRPSLHYWFGSTIRALGGALTNTGYYVNDACAEHWFYGGEIEARMDGAVSTPAVNRAIQMNRGDMRVFGSALRSHPGAYTGAVTGGYAGVVVGTPDPAVFHMHGGIINANSVGSTVAVDATALVASASSIAHTPDTAFVVKVGAAGGTATRASGHPDAISSPFLWEAGSTPPAVLSVDGEDLFVETDCDADGDCENADDEPHLMIYRASCGASPWFDAVTGRCRNVGP
ncbi:MAG: hypothetical protein QNK05_24325 [Myxococcota bacterium]|nr:hypothetical protein [Myxococcota bacterium]